MSVLQGSNLVLQPLDGSVAIMVQCPSTYSVNIFECYDGSSLISRISNDGEMFIPKLKGYNVNGSPTLYTGSKAGYMSSSSLTSNSNDLSGEIVVNAGSPVGGNDIVVQVTYKNAYTTAPFVTISPSNASTAETKVWVTSTTNTFYIRSNTSLSPLVQYKWMYNVIQ